MKRSNARSEDVAPSGSTRSPAASRRRRPHRAPLALASLVFLFVFGLGQISTIAGELKTEPSATETSETDASAEEEVATEDEPAEATDPEGSEDPTESAEATESTDAEAEEGATADSDVDASAKDESAVTDSKTETSKGTGTTTTEADTPGPASGDGVTPILIMGNPTCSDLMSGILFEYKLEPVRDATVPLSFEVDGTTLTGTLIVDVNGSSGTVDFSLTGDFVAAGVVVKGGPNANFFDYRPGGNASDTGLHAPVNPNNGQFYGLSHVSFCFVEGEGEGGVAAIDVEKTCPGSVDAGESIEFTITVTNTGTEALTDITVDDSLMGDITDDFDVDLAAGLAVGASATAVVTYEPGAEEESVENTVTATGTGVDSQDTDSDTATCVSDITQQPEVPAIQIVKDGPALVHRGDTITYMFAVTNTGDVELFDVVLTDPRCDTGTIQAGVDVDESLAVAEVWHFTCTHLVTDADPTEIPNTATVRGDTQEGEGGEEVTDTDDHTVGVITPAISIVKTVSDSSVEAGTVVTYTFVVTNTGDTTLFDVSVDDDVLGHIGTINMIGAGASQTLTATFTVGTSPVVNVATASGTDVLGKTVTDTDDAFVDVVLGTGGEAPPPGVGQAPPVGGATGGTAFTGSDTWAWALFAALLALFGVALLIATRKHHA